MNQFQTDTPIYLQVVEEVKGKITEWSVTIWRKIRIG